MSAYVRDENVVILKFDNSDFKKGTKESIKSLDALQQKISGSNSAKSLGNLSNVGRSFNLSGMVDSVNIVGKRFKWMGVVGMAAVNRLTNGAIDAGVKIAKALPSDIIEGGFTRAHNIEKAKFLIEGLGNAWDETSEKYVKGTKTVYTAIDNSVQGTAYALDQAATVAAQLMGSGIKDTEELEKALKSISGTAAVLSADYSRIGLIFAQVAGQGRLMGDDLLQLSQAGLGAASEIAKYLNANKDIAKQATDTAIANGKMTKSMKEISKHATITEADVREMVKAGAISFDILTGATAKFFEQAEKANDTYSGSLSNLRSAFNRMGAVFEETKLKNMTRIFNALIPVVKHLKTLMTPFLEGIGEASTKVTNFAVKAIGSLGKSLGMDLLDDTNKGFFRFANGLKRAAKEVGKVQDNISKSTEESGHKFIITAKEWKAAQDIWYKGSYGTYQRRADEIRKLGMSYENVQGVINEFYRVGFNWDKIDKEIIDSTKDKNKSLNDNAKTNRDLAFTIPPLVTAFTGLVNTIKAGKKAIDGVVNLMKIVGYAFKKFISSFVQGNTGIILEFTAKLIDLARAFKSLTDNVKGKAFDKIDKMAPKWVKSFSKLSAIFTKVFNSFYKGLMSVIKGDKKLNAFGKSFKSVLNIGKSTINLLRGIGNIIGFVVDKIANLITNFDKLKDDSIGKFLSDTGSKFVSWLMSLTEKLLDISKNFLEFTQAIRGGSDEVEKLTSRGEKARGIYNRFKDIAIKIKDAFDRIGSIVSNNLSRKIENIGNSFKSIRDSLTGFSKGGLFIGIIVKLADAFSNFITTLATGEKVSGSFFSVIGGIVRSIFETLSQAFDWIIAKVGPAFDTVIRFFKELGKSEGVENLKNSIGELVDNIGKLSNSGLDKVVGWFKELTNLAFDGASMQNVIDFFSGVANGMADFVNKVSQGENPLTTFFQNMQKFRKGFTFKKQAKASIGQGLKDAIDYPALSSSIGQIRSLDIGGKTLKNAEGLSNLLSKTSDAMNSDNLEGFKKNVFKDFKEGDLDKMSKIVLRFVSMGAIIKSTHDLAGLAKSFAGVAGSISGMFNSMRGIADSIAKQIRVEAFKTMAIAVALMAASIVALAAIPRDRMLPAAGVILAFMGIMTAILKITTLKNFNPRAMLDVGIAFAGMGTGMLMIAGAVAKLGKLEPDQLARGALAVTGFMAALVAVSNLARKLGGLGLVFVGIALAVTALVGAVQLFGTMDPSVFAEGMGKVVIGMFSLALAARIAGRGAKGMASFFAIAAALYALIPAIILMALIPTGKAIQGAATISGVMLAIGGAARLAGSGAGFKTMASMATTIGVLAASLIILSFIDSDSLFNAVFALISVISAIALSSAIMNTAKLAALTMVGVIAAITGAIVLLLEIDTGKALDVAMGLSAFALAMGAACALLTIAGGAAPAALMGILIMYTVIGSILLLVELLGALNKHSKVGEAVEEGGELLSKLGKALGKFASGFISGATDGLAESAKQLKEFTDVFVPLLKELGNINTEGITALKDLATAILAITGGGILDKIGSKFGSSKTKNMNGFAESLDSLAESFIPFVRKLSSGEGIGKSAIDKVKSFGDSVKVFADIAGALPKTSKINLGPLKASFGNVEDLDDFAKNVKKAAKTIGKTADDEVVKTFDKGKIAIIGNVGSAITTMSDVAKKLPKAGAWPTLSGKHDLGGFAKDLGDLVPKFKLLSKASNSKGEDGFGNLGNIQNVADAVTAMATAAASIPENTSGFHPIKGKKEIGAFAKDLAGMVPSFKTFSDAVGKKGENSFSTFKKETVGKVAGAVTAMAEAAASIPKDKVKSVGASISGNGKVTGILSKFAEDLGSFVTPFWNFSYKIAKHNKVFSIKNLDMVGRVGDALAKFADVKKKIAGVVEKTGGSLFDIGGTTGDGNSLDEFGDSLDSLSGNLTSFIEKTKEIVSEDIDEAGEKISSIAGLFDVFNGMGGTEPIKIPDGEDLVTFASNIKEFGIQMTGVEVDESKFTTIATYLETFKTKLEGIDIDSITEKADVVGKVGTSVGKFKEAIGDKIPTGANLVSLGGNIKTFCENIENAITDNIKSKTSKIKDTIKELVAVTKEAAGQEGAGLSMVTTGMDIAKKYISGLGSKLDAAEKKGALLSSRAKKGAGSKEAIEAMKECGVNLSQGLINGLSSKLEDVKAIADELVAEAERAAKAAGEIKSPSKVFARIGSYLGEGLIAGMSQVESEVSNVSNDMVSDAVKAANLAIQELDTISSPTITPVVDLSNVRKGARTIDSMVSSGKAISINSRVNSSASRYATPGMVSKLFDKIDSMSDKNSITVKGEGVGSTNYYTFNIDGAENPEDFADRFVSRLKMRTRTG